MPGLPRGDHRLDQRPLLVGKSLGYGLRSLTRPHHQINDPGPADSARRHTIRRQQTHSKTHEPPTEIFLSLRRNVLGPRHPQERQLRPLNGPVIETLRRVMSDIVHADVVTDRTCPIPFSVYAAEDDNIVTAPSAQSVFPDARALPGNHSTIARPTSRDHRTYTTLRRLILTTGDSDPLGPRGQVPLPNR